MYKNIGNVDLEALSKIYHFQFIINFFTLDFKIRGLLPVLPDYYFQIPYFLFLKIRTNFIHQNSVQFGTPSSCESN